MTGSRRSHTEAAAIDSSTHQRMAERQANSKREDSKEEEDDGKCKEKRECCVLHGLWERTGYSRWDGNLF